MAMSHARVFPGVPDRDADQGLHRGGARARVAGGGGGRRAARVVTPGRLVPVLPRPALSAHAPPASLGPRRNVPRAIDTTPPRDL